MSAVNPIPKKITPSVSLQKKASYSASSWLFFVVVVLINLGFFISHFVANSIRTGYLAQETLEHALFSGAYWFFSTGCVVFLMLSGLFIALTIALLVVRAGLHFTPCRYYCVILGIQILPWIYFIAVLPID
mgnify:CR=1 FL=1